MKPYAHMNKEERKVLAVMLERGESLRSIAQSLGRSPATLSREIRRNLTQQHYHPLRAEFLSRLRHAQCHRRQRLKSKGVRSQVERWLRRKWSPEIIAGRLAKRRGRKIVSPEAIYQWVYREAPHLIRFLPRKHPHRGFRRVDRSKVMILGRISVDLRPDEANLRLEPGHWEADLVVGRGRAALKVAVERKTRFTRLAKVSDKSAQASYLALRRIFSSVPPVLRKSVTYDNGTENVLHRELNSLFDLSSYFCYPGHALEKPTVENTNGLIRWFLPKRSNLDIIPDHKIRKIENWLNSRPRKCLGFQTPTEAVHSLGVALNH